MTKLNSPLIISDGNGKILYSAKNISESDAANAFLKASLPKDDCSILTEDGEKYFVKKVILKGEIFFFFMNSETLCSCFGEKVDLVANRLFDLTSLSAEKPQKYKLSSLLYFFLNTYADTLRDEGVKMEVRRLDCKTAVEVRPTAFILCLALMCRLAAESTRVVKLGVIDSYGTISVYVNSVGGEGIPCRINTLLKTLLYEVAGAAGFGMDEVFADGKRSFLLAPHPIDIGLLGFKAESYERFQKILSCYAAMF